MASTEQLKRDPYEKSYSSLCTEESPPKKNCSPRPKLFYSCGRSLIIITHYCCGKAKELPIPFGQLSVAIEKTIGSWMLPVIVSVEGQGLHLLTFADNQLCLIGGVAEYILPPISVLFEKAQKLEGFSTRIPDIVITTVDKLSVRGVVGLVADLWVKYEADMKDQTCKVHRMTQKIPLLSPIASVFTAVVRPFASMVSNWMLKHGEAEEKEVSSDGSDTKDVIEDTHDVAEHGSVDDHMFLGKEEPFAETSFASMVSNWMLKHGEAEEKEVSSDGNDTKDVIEDTHDVAEHGSVDDHIFLGKEEPFAETSGAIISKDNQQSDNMSQKGDKTSREADERKGVPEPIKVSDTIPDPILELFDASWHMKPSKISLKGGLSPKQKSRQ